MLAGQISDAVELEAIRRHPRDLPRLRREVPICVGERRLDVLAVNGVLAGFEVKSGSDGLARLDRQVAVYSKVLDQAVLVVERRHPLRLVDRLPPWWGLWQAVEDDEGTCRLDVVREAQQNPGVDAFALAQLLWRDEALQVLERCDRSRGLRAANRWRLWSAVADCRPLDELRSDVRSALRARREW